MPCISFAATFEKKTDTCRVATNAITDLWYATCYAETYTPF